VVSLQHLHHHHNYGIMSFFFEKKGIWKYNFFLLLNQDYGTLEEKVKSILKHYPDFRLGWGKKVCINLSKLYL
jgi:hypothetical protein